jgi:hypothetical protein
LKNQLVALLLCAAVLPFATSAQSQESPPTQSTPDGAANQKPSVEELAKLKQNPVSGLRQIVLQADVAPDLPGSGKTAGSYSFQAVWPFSLSENWKLISYSILPVLQLPGEPGASTTVGLGDTLISLFASPKKAGAVVWGFGPAILLPTRTDPALGSNRAGAGPSAVLYHAKDAWGVGIVVQNVWSFGGSGINKVNEFGAQYFANYNLSKGWYLYSNATITANWQVPEDDRWTVPLGGGAGRIFNIGTQPVNVSLQAFYNVVTPHDAPNWTAIFQFAFLFP